jgi:triacylglycerol lipase
MDAGDVVVFAVALLLLIVLAVTAGIIARRRRSAPTLPAHRDAPRVDAEPPAPAPAVADAIEPPPASEPIAEPDAPAVREDEGDKPSPPPAPLTIWVDRPLIWVPPARVGKPQNPVLLAHGFAGFDAIGVPGLRVAYFRGVAERLRAAGVDVHVLRVSPVASVIERARQLADQVRRLPGARFNLVAHSMGGLDARHALAALGLRDRIASLTTIGTPHHGTPLADRGLLLFGGTLGRLGVPLEAFHDLSIQRMERFNRETPDAPGVVYGSIISSAREVNALLVPAHRFLLRCAGDNDGIVPASSQRWGTVLGEVEVDHWGAVGWSTRFDAGAFYERLVLDLGAHGL